nr:hypothetical protein [Streptomyces chartreusis]
MEDPPAAEAESPYAHPLILIAKSTPYIWSFPWPAPMWKKHILDSYGMTIEEFTELFEHHSGPAGPDDD